MFISLEQMSNISVSLGRFDLDSSLSDVQPSLSLPSSQEERHWECPQLQLSLEMKDWNLTVFTHQTASKVSNSPLFLRDLF